MSSCQQRRSTSLGSVEDVEPTRLPIMANQLHCIPSKNLSLFWFSSRLTAVAPLLQRSQNALDQLMPLVQDDDSVGVMVFQRSNLLVFESRGSNHSSLNKAMFGVLEKVQRSFWFDSASSSQTVELSEEDYAHVLKCTQPVFHMGIQPAPFGCMSMQTVAPDIILMLSAVTTSSEAIDAIKSAWRDKLVSPLQMVKASQVHSHTEDLSYQLDHIYRSAQPLDLIGALLHFAQLPDVSSARMYLKIHNAHVAKVYDARSFIVTATDAPSAHLFSRSPRARQLINLMTDSRVYACLHQAVPVIDNHDGCITLFVPVRADTTSTVLGVVELRLSKATSSLQSILETVSILGSAAAVRLAAFELLECSQLKEAQTSAVLKIVRAGSQHQQMGALLDEIGHIIQASLRCRELSLYLLDASSNHYWCAWSSDSARAGTQMTSLTPSMRSCIERCSHVCLSEEETAHSPTERRSTLYQVIAPSHSTSRHRVVGFMAASGKQVCLRKHMACSRLCLHDSDFDEYDIAMAAGCCHELFAVLRFWRMEIMLYQQRICATAEGRDDQFPSHQTHTNVCDSSHELSDDSFAQTPTSRRTRRLSVTRSLQDVLQKQRRRSSEGMFFTSRLAVASLLQSHSSIRLATPVSIQGQRRRSVGVLTDNRNLQAPVPINRSNLLRRRSHSDAEERANEPGGQLAELLLIRKQECNDTTDTAATTAEPSLGVSASTPANNDTSSKASTARMTPAAATDSTSTLSNSSVADVVDIEQFETSSLNADASPSVTAGSALPLTPCIETPYSNCYFSGRDSLEAQLETALAQTDVCEWDVNVLDLPEDCVLPMFHRFFQRLELSQSSLIDISKLSPFLDCVQQHYHDNPFHNFCHGIDVAHSVFMLLVRTQAMDLLQPLEVAALLIAGVCHDIDHPGYSNDFVINCEWDLALRYNDISVLENHHAALTCQLLRRPDLDLFHRLDTVQRKCVRQVIVTSILATDMKQHVEIIKNMQTFSPAHPFTKDACFNTQAYCESVLHTADLGGQALEWDIASEWGKRIVQEFQTQHTEEVRMGIPATPHMAGLDTLNGQAQLQIGFCSYVVLPLWQALSELYPALEDRVHQLQTNIEHYKEQVTVASDGSSGDTDEI